MDKIFNSSFEMGLRVLLLLSTIKPQSATLDRIVAYDFITIYSRDFGITDNNLHGDNCYNFSELASKRIGCNEGIKEFVLDGLISANREDGGFTYAINQKGQRYVDSLKSDYVTQYLRTAKQVHKKFIGSSDEKLLMLINKKAIQELRRKS